jgi:hypothetical protein
MTRTIRVTVSGSFHRHMEAIASAVAELQEYGAQVLSPADPRIVDQKDEFLFVASDRLRSVRLVQDRHLEAIRSSNFLWLVSPDGYVGQSASMEIGFAAAMGVPVLGAYAPTDLTLRQYVTLVPSLVEALCRPDVAEAPRQQDGILIDPHSSVEKAHDVLERINRDLTHAQGRHSVVRSEIADVHGLLQLPTSLH